MSRREPQLWAENRAEVETQDWPNANTPEPQVDRDCPHVHVPSITVCDGGHGDSDVHVARRGVPGTPEYRVGTWVDDRGAITWTYPNLIDG